MVTVMMMMIVTNSMMTMHAGWWMIDECMNNDGWMVDRD